MTFCLFNGVYRHVQQYFSYIVAVSFIVGGNAELIPVRFRALIYKRCLVVGVLLRDVAY
jgi:hypothetical protein